MSFTGFSGRPQYNADERWNEHRRKIKPHVKIHHSATNHPRTAGLWQDDHLLARWIRVLMAASEKGAAHTWDILTLRFNELPDCMGLTRIGPARRALNALAGLLGWRVIDNPEARTVQVTIRNFARKQGLTPRKPRSDGGDSAVPPTPHTTTATEFSTDVENSAEPSGSASSNKKTFEAYVWSAGLRYLVETGDKTKTAEKREKSSRSLLGKLRKDYGDENVVVALVRAQKEGVSDPMPWLLKTLAHLMRLDGKTRKVELTDVEPHRTIDLLPGARIVWQDASEGGINGHQTSDGTLYLTRGKATWL